MEAEPRAVVMEIQVAAADRKEGYKDRPSYHQVMSSISEIDPRLRDASAATFRPGLPTAHPTASQGASPQQSIYPNTPQSAGNVTDPDGLGGAHDGDPDDPKRPRACEACRGLKVRCEPDPNNVEGPCKRCAKAHRNCVVTVPSRKRQKKTDSRVAELERKIDALTASLQASQSGPLPVAHSRDSSMAENLHIQNRPNPYQQVTNGGYGSPFPGRPEPRVGNEWAGYPNPRAPEFDVRTPSVPPMVVAGHRRKYAESREYPATSDTQSSSMGGSIRKSVDSGPSTRHNSLNPPTAVQPWQKPAGTHEYTDVVDRELITAEMASDMFTCFVERMTPHMPAIAFPPGTTAADVRKSKPTLFLAILSASSGLSHPTLQKVLTKELMSIYADRIICNGEKTLELIQALQVSALWYWPPEHFEELKFYQLIHIAAVMAIDIGMGKRSKSSKPKAAGLWRDHAWRRTPYPDPESIEARRAWLGCYFLCCTASMGLRRPNLVRWTHFMADCVDVLEHSPEAAPSDKALCQWVRSQHIAEEIGTQFSMDDPVANVSIADAKVQHALKGFERDLEKWCNQIQPEVQSTTLTMTGHVVNLYMHEVAMHVDHNVEEFKPPFTEDTLRNVSNESESLSTAHISALSVCLQSIDGIFDAFLTYDVETVRCLPVGHFVRVAYAVVVLIKMYFAAAAPNSELGKVINKNDMKVEQYLDRLVDIFKASAANEKSRPAAKFLMVLIMLKTWFLRQREGGKPSASQTSDAADSTIFTASSYLAAKPESDGPLTSSTESNNHGAQQNFHPAVQQPNYSPSNTPLQLLSEVATGNSRAQAGSGHIGTYPGTPSDWQQSQQQQQPPYQNYDQLANSTHPPLSQGYGNMNLDPSLGMDLGYTMGDGFEQAMGMTLGFGDLSTYFGDDALFGSLMDSVGGAGGGGFDGV